MSAPVSNLRRTASPTGDNSRLPFADNLVGHLLDIPEFHSLLNEDDRRQFLAIGQEADPELLMESLISRGSRWEAQGREIEAAQLYYHLLSLAPAGSCGLDRIRSRFDALQGRGSFGARFEVASRHFFRQATDPAMIFGFMAAGGVASMVRGFTLGNLALRAPSLLTRGWAARGIAGAAGMAAEIPTLVGSTRLAHGVLGYREGFGSFESLPQELAGATVFLGALKLSGLATTALTRNSSYAPWIRSGGTLGGIYVAHRAEERLGLRHAATSEMNRWFDVGETFLQLQIGGRLSNALLGARNPALELSVRERVLAEGLRELAPAREPSPTWRLQLMAEAAVAAYDENEKTNPNITLDATQRRLGETLGPRATSVVARSFESIQRSLDLKEDSPWLDVVRGSKYQDIRGFELAMQRLNHAVLFSRPGGVTGSYLNWITRLAVQNVAATRDNRSFDRMLQLFAEGGPIIEIERIASEMSPQRRSIDDRLVTAEDRNAEGFRELAAQKVSISRLFDERPFMRTMQIFLQNRLRSESYRTVRELPAPIGKEAKQSLISYLQSLPNESNRVAVARLVQNSLGRYPENGAALNSGLERARTSPAGIFRMLRLLNLLEFDGHNSAKFAEMTDDDLSIRGRGNLIPLLATPEAVRGTQDDGYIGEPELAQELSLVYREMHAVTDHQVLSERRARTREILETVWPNNRVPFDVPHITQALRLFDDPTSRQIVDDLSEGRVRLIFLSNEALRNFRRGYDKGWNGGDFYGLFVPASRDASGKNSIYLRDRGPASNAVYLQQNLESLANLVHEHTHSTRAERQENRTSRGVFLEEGLAEARALLWKVTHGNAESVRHLFESSPAGLGFYLSDWVDLRYILRQQKDI